jgi:arylformamidase
VTILYRGMDRVALDAAYNNTKAIPDFPETLARFQGLSAELYEAEAGRCRRDVAYGAGARQRFDWIGCGRSGAPTFIFIHGGYWQNCVKEDFAFVARGALNCGINVVLVEYTLAPVASMTQIVGEIGALLDFCQAHADEFEMAGRPVCLSGHSAGGQLAALYRDHPLVTYAMPISALVDLEPISLCWLNDELQLTAQEIDAFSPIRHIGKGVPMTVTVGAAELPELVRHSREYAEGCRGAGESVEYVPVPGCTHFSVLEDLASSDRVQMNALARAIPVAPWRRDARIQW